MFPVKQSRRLFSAAVVWAFIGALAGISGCTSPDNNTLVLETVALDSTTTGSHLIKVEVARSSDQLWRGLRWRKSLGEDQGMLFDLGRVRWADFTMRDTLIPLDMLFVSANGQVVTIHSMTTPGKAGPYSSTEPVRAVLELKGGAAGLYEIGVGDYIRHDLFGTQPTESDQSSN